VKRYFVVCAAFVGMLTISGVIAWHAGFRYNDTASFPVGIWRLTPGVPHKEALVFFKPPEDNPAILWGRDVGILQWQFGRSTTMIKRIVAVSGDRIDIADTVSVNGVVLKNSHVYRHDQAGRSIPSVAHSGIVPDGKVWLMSDYAEMSFDSRYFGPVDTSAILGLAHPVYTW
jgi:conjugative transfer signal peptidase TraF